MARLGGGKEAAGWWGGRCDPAKKVPTKIFRERSGEKDFWERQKREF